MDFAKIGIIIMLAGVCAFAFVAIASGKALDSIRKDPFHRSGDSFLIYLKGCSAVCAIACAAAACALYFLH